MRGTTFFLSVFVLALLFTNGVAAEDVQESQIEQKISLRTVDGFAIGVQSYLYKYEEEVNGAFFMSNEGGKYGFSLEGVKTIGDDYYVAGDVRFATGDVEYESASGKGDVSDSMYEVRLLAGKEAILDGYLLASYIGFGYRHLDNDLRDLGAGGYRRESDYLYVPIGVVHRIMLNKSARISTTIEYDYFVSGEQKSYLSDVGPANAALYGDPVNKQKNGYGLRIDTAYEEKNWSIGVFFNYWSIKDSETNYYTDGFLWYSVMEPKNDTKELGVELKYRF